MVPFLLHILGVVLSFNVASAAVKTAVYSCAASRQVPQGLSAEVLQCAFRRA